jgi:type I restriction enzyme S subunit
MSEWKEYNITEVCDTISDTYRDGADKVILINTSDVLEGKVTNHELVPNKNLAGQFKKKFQKDDILYSEIRPANRRYAYVDFEPKDYIASTKLMVLRNKPCILPKYLYYLLTNNNTIRNLHAIAVGRSGTFPQITYSELANIKFLLPSIDEQEKILSTLLDFDNKIAVNRSICENLEAQAKALFKYWFIDFVPFKDEKFIESELGMIPEGWKVGTLGDIADFKRGRTITKTETKEGNVPVVAGGLEPAYYHNKANTSSRVITISGSGANAGFTRLYYQPVWASDCSYVDNVSTLYLHTAYCYLLNSRKKVDALQWGAAQPHVYAKDINKLPLAVAPLDLLSKFEEQIIEMFDQIEILEKENIRLTILRDTLLPKLMSGQIKL